MSDFDRALLAEVVALTNQRDAAIARAELAERRCEHIRVRTIDDCHELALGYMGPMASMIAGRIQALRKSTAEPDTERMAIRAAERARCAKEIQLCLVENFADTGMVEKIFARINAMRDTP